MSGLGQRYGLATKPGSLALECDPTGLRLAGVPLLKMTPRGFAPRSPDEVSALLIGAYGADIGVDKVAGGLDVIAQALNRGDIGLAMVAAVRLKLPELNWIAATRITQANDRLEKYNPDEPRDRRGRWTTGDEAAAATQPPGSSGSVNSTKLPAADETAIDPPPLPTPSLAPDLATTDASESPRNSDDRSGVLADPGAALNEVNPDTLTPIDYMGRFHDVVVANYANYLRSRGETVQTEVRLVMADGSAGARIDILAWDPRTGIVYGVEVKTGINPRFTKGQAVIYPHLMMGGSVKAIESKVIAVGLFPNIILPPIPIYQYYKKDENSEHKIDELDPRDFSRYLRRKK